MKKSYRFVVIVSMLALGLGGIIVPTAPRAQADPSAQVGTGAANQKIRLNSGATADEVRLVTGDLVDLSADGQVTQITPVVRPDGTTPRFSVTISASQVYVVPSDVASLVPDQLDRELFNVTALASYDLGPTLPVIVVQPEDTSVKAGAQEASDLGVDVTDTLDAAGAQVGQVDVSADNGPAPAWDLLDELATAPTSSTDPISSQSKVWLDGRVHVDGVTAQAVSMGSEPAWMSLIGKDEANEEGYTGDGVKVAVVDSGVNSSHPDLAGKIVAERDFSGSGSPTDGIGHGTFVASEILGTGAASDGTYAGVAPDATLINARVLDGSGDGSDSSILAGVEWAAEQGADVINMSIGWTDGYDDGTSFPSQAINRIARQYDCVIVVSAGNDGAAQTINAPATADEAIAVGATDSTGKPTVFSSYGPRRGDGAVKPEVLAPGLAITAASAFTGGYMSADGTSMAAPLVSGAAALLRGADPSADRTQIRAKLMASAQPVATNVFRQGAGLVDIPAAIAQTVTTTPTQLNFGTLAPPYPAGVTATLTYLNTGSEDQTYTLTTSSTFTTSLGKPTQISDAGADQAGIDPASDDLSIDGSGGISVSAGTITVPAGGQTSILVTVDPTAFDEGYVGGYVTATSSDDTVIQTPIGWANAPTSFTVTAQAVSAPLVSARIVNLDTGEFTDVNPSDGASAVFQVTSGNYIVEGYSLVANTDIGDTYVYMLTPAFQVDSSTTIRLDSSQAVPVDFQFDQPVTSTPSMTLRYTLPSGQVAYEVSENPPFGDSVSGDRLAVTPVMDTTDGTWSLVVLDRSEDPAVLVSSDCGETTQPVWGLLSEPGQASYTLVNSDQAPAQAPADSALVIRSSNLTVNAAMDAIAQATNGGYEALIADSTHPTTAWNSLQAGLAAYPGTDIPIFVGSQITGDKLDVLTRGNVQDVYRFTSSFDLSQGGDFVVTPDGNTAVLRIEHRDMGPGSATDTWNATSDDLDLGGSATLSVPSAYTLYAEPDVDWGITSEYASGDSAVIAYRGPQWSYAPGEHYTIALGAAVTSLSLGTTYVTREADELDVSALRYIDGQGSLEAYQDPEEVYPDFGQTTVTIKDVTTGDLLVSAAPNDDLTANVSSDEHTYQMDVTATTPGDLWTLSNSVTARWTWQSQTTDWQIEPLRQAWYELPGLDAANNGSGDQTIIVHADQLGTAPLPDQVTLQASTDGGMTWRNVPVQLTAATPDQSTGSIQGEDLYVGHIQANPGDTVSLTSSISGGGSSFDQTVVNAYQVTDDPQGFPVASWSCETGGGNGDTTAPDVPRIDTANAAGVSGGPGAAEADSIVTVTFPGGNSASVTAAHDGSYLVEIPQGTVSGQVRVSAADAAGNQSESATMWLDVDLPAAPRIDRADMVEVSGGIGAVEAFALVRVTFPDGTTGTAEALENGSYSVPTPAGMAVGTVTVTAGDEAGNVSGSSTAQLVAPVPLTATMKYAQVHPGETQTVTGDHFAGGEQVTVSMCPSCSTISTVTASPTGRVTQSFTVPSSYSAGQYTVTLTGASGTTTATFEVVAVPPPSPIQCLLTLWVTLILKLLFAWL